MRRTGVMLICAPRAVQSRDAVLRWFAGVGHYAVCVIVRMNAEACSYSSAYVAKSMTMTCAGQCREISLGCSSSCRPEIPVGIVRQSGSCTRIQDADKLWLSNPAGQLPAGWTGASDGGYRHSLHFFKVLGVKLNGSFEA